LSGKSAIVDIEDDDNGGYGKIKKVWTTIISDASAASGIQLQIDRAARSIEIGRHLKVAVRICTKPADLSGSSTGDVDTFIVDGVGSCSTSDEASAATADAGVTTDSSGLSMFNHLSLTTPSTTASSAADLPMTFLERHLGYVSMPRINIEKKTSRKVAVTWTLPSFGLQPDKMQVILDMSSSLSGSGRHVFFVNVSKGRFKLPADTLQAGERYRITVRALKMSTCPSPRPLLYVDNYWILCESSLEFRADMTLTELEKLHQKALNNTHRNAKCLVVYRNKSPTYFQEMFEQDRGIMKVYKKDNSGDPASPINGQIDGLFFMAEVQPYTDGEPYHASAFGSTRLIVPVRVLLNLTPNIYFTDFYCMRGQFHYVTLVLTKDGSTADRFCRERLLPLSRYDRLNNPFLFEDSTDGNMKVAEGVKVELLCTENLNVNDLVKSEGAMIKENTRLIGKGSSTPGGLRKRPTCTVCNLYPISLNLFSVVSAGYHQSNKSLSVSDSDDD
jgi:hypothetical protein